MTKRARVEKAQAARGVFYNFTHVAEDKELAIEQHPCNAHWALLNTNAANNSSNNSTDHAMRTVYALRAVVSAFDLVKVPLSLWRSSAQAWRLGCNLYATASLELFAPFDYVVDEPHFDLLVVRVVLCCQGLTDHVPS